MDLIKIREKLLSGESIYKLPLKVAYYARVSTDKEEQQNSLFHQKSYYEKLISENPEWIFSGGYVDEGISGTGVMKRTCFLKMIEDAKLGKFDLIITKEISRFSRNTLDSLKYTRELLDHGVGVFFQSDGINTLLPDAELRLAILSSIAQDEVRKLSERVRFGFKRAQESGVVLGNDNLYGYQKKNGKLSVIPEEAEVVKEIFRAYTEERLGIRRLAKELNEKGIRSRNGKEFCYASLYSILKNPKYKGFYAGNKTTTLDFRSKKRMKKDEQEWILHPDKKIPAIVDEKVWDLANRILKERGRNVKEKKIRFQNRYSYSGKIICGLHRASFHRILVGKEKKEAWFCREYRLKGKTKGCGGPYFYTDELDEWMEKVWSNLNFQKEKVKRVLNEALEKCLAEQPDPAREIAVLKGKALELERKKEGLFELYFSHNLSGKEFEERNEKLNASLDRVTNQIEDLKKREKTRALEKKVFRESERLLDEYRFEKEEVKDFNSRLLDRIEVYGTREKPILHIYLKGLGVKGAIRKSDSILLWDMGISQAQVSRLEKSALERIRKEM